MEERKLFYNKKKLRNEFITMLLTFSLNFVLFNFLIKYDFECGFYYQIMTNVVLVIILIFHLKKYLSINTSEPVFIVNNNGISSYLFNDFISWKEIINIDLNYNTFKTDIVLFFRETNCKKKRKIGSPVLSYKKKQITIHLNYVEELNSEKLYHEMHDFLAPHKPLIEKEQSQ